MEITQERIDKIKIGIQRCLRQGDKPPEIWKRFKAYHSQGKFPLTPDDVVWIGYFLGYKYQWAIYAACEIGLYSKNPQIQIIPRKQENGHSLSQQSRD